MKTKIFFITTFITIFLMCVLVTPSLYSLAPSFNGGDLIIMESEAERILRRVEVGKLNVLGREFFEKGKYSQALLFLLH